MRILTQDDGSLLLSDDSEYAVSLSAAVSPEPLPSGCPTSTAAMVLCADFDLETALTTSTAGPATSNSRRKDRGTLCLACLGVIDLAGDLFVMIVTKVTDVNCASSVTGLGRPRGVKRIKEVDLVPIIAGFEQAHITQAIKKLLESGSFYLSTEYDLTTRLSLQFQRQPSSFFDLPDYSASEDLQTRHPSSDLTCSPDYVFNLIMLAPLLQMRSSLRPDLKGAFDRSPFAVPCVQGFFGEAKVSLGGRPAVLGMVSRLNWRRTGTPFNCRGLNEEGYVANHVETETILTTSKSSYSHVLVRGTVPLLWSETPKLGKISINIRPLRESIRPLRLHFSRLLTDYGQVHCLDLLDASCKGKLGPEKDLGEAYKEALNTIQDQEDRFLRDIEYDSFNFEKEKNSLARIEKALAAQLGEQVDQLEHSAVTNSEQETASPGLAKIQGVVFRVNCRNCLDRTNIVQSVLSQMSLKSYVVEQNLLSETGIDQSDLLQAHRLLWSENGNALSVNYSGTGSMNSNLTRTGHSSAEDLIRDLHIWEQRLYQCKSLDASRQFVIEQLLGKDSQKLAVAWYPTPEFLAKNRTVAGRPGGRRRPG